MKQRHWQFVGSGERGAAFMLFYLILRYAKDRTSLQVPILL